MRRRLSWVGGVISIIALSLATRPEVGAISVVDTGCPQTSTQTQHKGPTLQGFAGTGIGGVVYDGTDQSLKLKKEGGIFSSAFFAATGTPQYTCSADFDRDGWVDFAAATADGRSFGFYKNKTADNLVLFPPNWILPSYVLPPKFTLLGNAYFFDAGFVSSGGGVAACGDFNADGKDDFAVVLENGDDGGVATFARMFLGNGNGTFQAPYNLTSNWANDFQNIMWDGNMAATDYNGDAKLDLLFGAYDAGGGFVRVFLNNGATPPVFTPSAYLVQSAGLGARGVGAVAWADFTGDGRKDLAITGSSSDKLKLYPGLSGGGVSATAQVLTTLTGGAILLAADFSLDGKVDLILATDQNSGQVRYYKNNATTTPFSAFTSITETFTDFDTGFFFNYDNDPESTPDLMLADGNGAGYATFANRVVSTYVACGDVASGVLDLGALANEEMVVTAARLTPTTTMPAGTSITYYMSNEEPAVWQLTSACIDNAAERCVSFPQPVGRTVRWKATMCSNAAKTATPKITDVKVRFNYTLAEEHFRGGVVVDDGVAYVGAFRQPGDRGHFYATNAGLTKVYWDAGVKLDAMSDSSRKIYTASIGGATRLDFDNASSNQSALKATLGAANQTQAASVIAWQRTARFGIAGGGVQKTRLGAVETSTPAVVSPPTRPLWYFYLSSQQKQEANTFIQNHEHRPVLALFGSKDGPLHAVRNQPSAIAASSNGTEAWAFMPPRVAARLIADQTNSAATAFVDGSPTLADVRLSDGAIHTVVIVPGGNGASAVFALDVTSTISSSGTVTGPTPLWETLPGDDLAGLGRAKPAVARVKIGGAETFIAILATGIARDNPTAPYSKGRDVVAINIATGQRMWRFKTACAVTADPVVFETDDDAEPGTPELNGYIDRLILADACGYVYKLDPAVSLPGSAATDGWIDSSSLGSVATGQTDPAGHAVKALFSTRLTTGAIAGDRPIAGTIGTHTDITERVVLFFGTGGLESFDPSLRNEFYAIYADTGKIRNKIVGGCASGACEKFYGGVVVSTDQVILTRATDPPVANSTCTMGKSEVTGVDIDNLSVELAVTTGSATVSALYGHAGAVYFTTLAGDLVRVGTPAASEAGGESGGGGQEGGEDEPTSESLGIMGWRQVL